MRKDKIQKEMIGNITYLKLNYQITDIIKEDEIKKVIDINNIYSEEEKTNKKINDFFETI